MSETPAETKARFRAKNEEFAKLARACKWPMLECEKCRYYACVNCDKHPAKQPALSCDRCGALVVQRIGACCQRDHHHIGDCCTHCGNDERDL